MRISKKKKKPQAILPRYNLNNRILSPQVRVIDEEDNNLGVMPTSDALKMAYEKELDLVEINPKAEPPVVKVIDFKHFKYQKEKEIRKQKINSKISELKGVRLSIRISDHDLDTRKMQAEKFLERGDKVKIEIILKGRERSKSGMAYDVIKKFIETIKEKMYIRTEQEVESQGNKITAIIAKQ
jgi:translation initiation factor IF-3